MSLVSVALSIRHYGTNIPSEQQDGLSQSVCGRKSFLFFRPRVSAAGNHFCFSVTECLWPKIIFVFPSQSVCGWKSFLFFRPRVSAAENHFCFSITECLRLEIIFVFPSQSVCGRKSFLFFYRRVSAAENHFCFFIPECLWPEIIFVFLSQSVCGRKSFLFFRHRVSAARNHFCFFITECQTTDANSLYRLYNIFRPIVRVLTDAGPVPIYGRFVRVGLSIKPDSRNLYKTYT